MIATPTLPLPIAIPNPTRLTIKYVSRLPPLPTTRPRAPSLTNLTATVTENPASQTYTISTSILNSSKTPETHNLTISAWPMFAPEDARVIARRKVVEIKTGGIGGCSVDVRMSELGVRAGEGKVVLEEGIYMFEVRSECNSGDGMAMGKGTVSDVIKQVCVVGRREWDA